MKFAIISGSARSQSESIKIARYIENELKLSHEVFVLDLAGNPIPLWDEGIFSGLEPWPTAWYPIREKLAEADALILIVPEWHGMAPATIRNLLQLSTANELGHKPALLVGVSSSLGGAMPVAELRGSAYKNNRICFIPEHLIIRNSGNVMGPGAPVSADDEYLRKRCSYALNVLVSYAAALQTVRLSGVIDHKTFPNGMS